MRQLIRSFRISHYFGLVRLFFLAGKKRKHLQKGRRPWTRAPPRETPRPSRPSKFLCIFRSSEQHIKVSARSEMGMGWDGMGNEWIIGMRDEKIAVLRKRRSWQWGDVGAEENKLQKWVLRAACGTPNQLRLRNSLDSVRTQNQKRHYLVRSARKIFPSLIRRRLAASQQVNLMFMGRGR